MIVKYRDVDVALVQQGPYNLNTVVVEHLGHLTAPAKIARSGV